MQMRYQLRHTPNGCVLRSGLLRTTRRILANRLPRCEIGGPVPRHEAQRTPRDRRRRAPCGRSCPCPAACVAGGRLPAEQRDRGDPQGGAVAHHAGRAAGRDGGERLTQGRQRCAPGRRRSSRRRAPRRRARRSHRPRSSAACSAGYAAANSGIVRPARSPTSYSRRRASCRTSSPVASATAAAVGRGAGEVGAPQDLRAQRGDGRGHRRRLGAADVVEADVEVSLGATLRVPGGLPVAQEDQGPRSPHSSSGVAASLSSGASVASVVPAWAAPGTSATSGVVTSTEITGQSRHSRSRA